MLLFCRDSVILLFVSFVPYCRLKFSECKTQVRPTEWSVFQYRNCSMNLIYCRVISTGPSAVTELITVCRHSDSHWKQIAHSRAEELGKISLLPKKESLRVILFLSFQSFPFSLFFFSHFSITLVNETWSKKSTSSSAKDGRTYLDGTSWAPCAVSTNHKLLIFPFQVSFAPGWIFIYLEELKITFDVEKLL